MEVSIYDRYIDALRIYKRNNCENRSTFTKFVTKNQIYYYFPQHAVNCHACKAIEIWAQHAHGKKMIGKGACCAEMCPLGNGPGINAVIW